MHRCSAKTQAGSRCLRAATHGDFCSQHRDQVSAGEAAAVFVGAILGNTVAPGLGGMFVGGVAGKLARSLIKDAEPTRRKVFVSFDFDEDRALRHLILGQLRNPQLKIDIVDHSLKEAAPEKKWEDKAKRAIARADLVLVIVGPKTHRAKGVLKEVAMARQLGVKVVQMIGYSQGDYIPVPNAGKLYAWSFKNLQKLLT
jgi:cellobiose-specific phosphotransferase system component IIB